MNNDLLHRLQVVVVLIPHMIPMSGLMCFTDIREIPRGRGTVPWYSRQLERLNNTPVMGSRLEWTVPLKRMSDWILGVLLRGARALYQGP